MELSQPQRLTGPPEHSLAVSDLSRHVIVLFRHCKVSISLAGLLVDTAGGAARGLPAATVNRGRPRSGETPPDATTYRQMVRHYRLTQRGRSIYDRWT
jgi:hypothetical protein